MRIKAVCFVALLLFQLATSLPAQEITGNISGTVTDPSGGGIPDADVVVTNTSTGVERSTRTTSAGIFFFSNLPVGDSVLAVSKPGFKKSETTSIHLNVNDKLAFPITMVLGAVNEVVTVTSEAAVLQTENAEVSNLVGNDQMKALPLNQRDFGQLVDLVPGVAPDNGRVGINDTSVSVNGNQSNSNLYLVDGTFDEDNGNNGGIMVRPSVDSIEEFKILRNNYSPEFGEATGAIVNVVTKSGGKDFHGSLFEFLRNDKLDASDPFLGAPGKLRYNDYGVTIGGPVWIPKVYNTDRKSDFFFFSTEFSREIRGNTVTGTVPTARQRAGILDPNSQPPDPQEFVVDEPNFTGTPDPNAVAFLDRYPLPNTDISNGFNFIASSPAVSNFDHYAIRWDHQFGAKATLMANYMQTNTPLAGLNSDGFWGDDNFPSVNSDWNTKAKLANIKLTTVISSRTVNDFQFGYSNNVIDIKTSTVSDPTLASRSGFTYTELFPETSGSFPALNLNDGFDGLQHTAPFFDLTHNFQYRDDLTHSFGKHNLKVGFFARFSRKLEPANGGGDFTAGSFDVLSLNDLLAGNVSQYTEQEANNDVPSRGRDFALYFQDTFKVSSSFTLDYGLRWQYLGQVFSVENNVASFYPDRYDPALCPSATAFVVDPVTGSLVVDPATCDTLNGIVTQKTPGVDKSLRDPHYRDFEPRVGFAWSPLSSKKLLLRAGGGIYHGRDAFSQNSATGQLPPFNNNPVVNGITFSSMTTPFDPATPQPPGALNVLEKSYPNPQSYQYSLGVQYELMPRTSLEVNYVGARQIHLGRNRNINQVPATFQPAIANFVNNGCTPDPAPTTASTCVDPNTVRPFLGYDFINVNERAATSRYNSLQVFFNRQMSHGLAFQASYTYSRNIATTANRDSEARDLPMQDAFHPEREKAVAIQDIPHSLVFNYVWQLPFARRSNGILKVLAAGWQINGISTFRSGRPVNICLQNDNAGLGDSGICERPDITGNPILDKSKRSLTQWFNTSAFSVPALGTFGNGGRNPVRGSGINNWDLSIFKVTDFPWFGRHSGWNTAETAKLEFRAEMFNVWNHPQFSDPGSTLGDADFGQITGLGINPREVQFGLRIEF
jgi:outer membrane receptor protein involved in Fe transport